MGTPAKAWTAVPSSLASCVISEGRAESQEELPELPHRIWLILPLGDTLKKQTHPNSSAGVSTAKPGVTSQARGVVLVFPPPAFPQFQTQDEGTGGGGGDLSKAVFPFLLAYQSPACPSHARPDLPDSLK